MQGALPGAPRRGNVRRTPEKSEGEVPGRLRGPCGPEHRMTDPPCNGGGDGEYGGSFFFFFFVLGGGVGRGNKLCPSEKNINKTRNLGPQGPPTPIITLRGSPIHLLDISRIFPGFLSTIPPLPPPFLLYITHLYRGHAPLILLLIIGGPFLLFINICPIYEGCWLVNPLLTTH